MMMSAQGQRMTSINDAPSLAERFESALSWEQFLAATVELHDLWLAVARRAEVPEEFARRAREIPGRWKLLVLAEDWCGDAVNSLPYIAALQRAAPNIELRLLGRDANPDLMDAHLTGTSRSIPVVMLLDETYREVAWWGPRPAELQSWFRAEGVHIESAERYRQMRQWYARDRGRSTLEEVIGLIERAAYRAAA